MIVAAIALILLIAWATSPSPAFNQATFEDQPLDMQIAPLAEAVTLAQVRRANGTIATLVVLALEGDRISAVNLANLDADESDDPFTVLASVDPQRLTPSSLATEPIEQFAIADLLPAAPSGDRHIATGTNFPEHAEEAGSGKVFQFPKFGRASGARMTVAARPETLLDYEVELCMRFDRMVASVEDFDAAAKGVFLCGDFTDRAKLIRLLKTNDLDAGIGFSDGKSREDFYPSGALLVVPRDWQAFVAEERMTTAVNGQPRQDARGGEMTLDFRGLTEKALGDMERERFQYQGEMYRLAPQPAITPDMTLMSGTSEGVIFTSPSRADLIEAGLAWVFGGGWLRGESFVDTAIETFVENKTEAGIFLQPGDVVTHESSRLGDIVATVTAE